MELRGAVVADVRRTAVIDGVASRVPKVAREGAPETQPDRPDRR